MQVDNNYGHRDVFYGRMFALFLNAVLIVDLFRMLLGDRNSVINALQYSIYIGTTLYVIWKIIYIDHLRIDKSLFSWIFALGSTTFVSYLECPGIKDAMGYFGAFFLTRIFPALYLSIYIDNKKINTTFECLLRYRFVWLAYAIVGGYWVPTHTINSYSLTFGYNLLLPSCITAFCCIKTFQPKWLIYTGIFGISMLLQGSRASVLCLLFFAVIAYILINKGNPKTGVVLRLMAVMFVAIIVILNFKNIINSMIALFPTSRTLRLLSNNFKFDSGRGSIRNTFYDGIKNNPLKFNGIFSDRVFYSNAIGTEFNLTNHPHSLLIELIYQFGIVGGFILIVVLLHWIVKLLFILFKQNNHMYTFFFLFFLVAGIVKLFFSASYLMNVETFLFLGFIIAIRNYKYANTEDQ